MIGVYDGFIHAKSQAKQHKKISVFGLPVNKFW
jgi:hypothetical protein